VKDDTIEIVKKYRDCQFYQKQTTKHANSLRPIDVSWPFAVWGIDIMSILPRAPGGFRYLFIEVNTFTIWMEVVPSVNITQDAAVKFLQSIIYRFDMPRRVLTDNGTQFKWAKFTRSCVEFDIQHQPSSAAYP
jgi:transposase InsO family protein